MDIQSNLQNQQNYQSQQSNPQNRLKDISGLDAVTEYAVNALTEKAPSYFLEYEKTFTEEIRNYGVGLIQDCKNGKLLELSDEALEEALEDGIGSLLDASCVLNREHFKSGIRFGALLIMQLLI